MTRREFWIFIAVLSTFTAVMAVRIAIDFVQAGTRLKFRCDGDVGIYAGAVRGEPVFTINPYDRRCIDAEPIYPGDSSPSATPSGKASQ